MINIGKKKVVGVWYCAQFSYCATLLIYIHKEILPNRDGSILILRWLLLPRSWGVPEFLQSFQFYFGYILLIFAMLVKKLFSFGYERCWRTSVNDTGLCKTSFYWWAFQGIQEISKTNSDLICLWSFQQIRLRFFPGKMVCADIYIFLKSRLIVCDHHSNWSIFYYLISLGLEGMSRH